jgi:hypothetical protein
MELKVNAEEEAQHAFSRTASQHDPQECGAWRQGNIALIHSAPTEEREKLLPLPSLSEATKQFSLLSLWLASRSLLSGVHSRDPLARKDGKTSMPALGFFHRRELLGTGLALKSRLPGLIGHAVDCLAAFVLAHLGAPRVGLLLEPVGQAVAAEACKIHEIDILDIGAGAQMLDQAPENGGFEFRSGFVVWGHDRDLAVLREAY